MFGPARRYSDEFLPPSAVGRYSSTGFVPGVEANYVTIDLSANLFINYFMIKNTLIILFICLICFSYRFDL